MILLDEYDGEKMLFDIDDNKLFVWHSNEENYEEWFCITPLDDKNNLTLFFNGKISLYSFMKEAKLNIAKRFYDTYDLFHLSRIVPDEENYTFPTKKSFFTGQIEVITRQQYQFWSTIQSAKDDTHISGSNIHIPYHFAKTFTLDMKSGERKVA